MLFLLSCGAQEPVLLGVKPFTEQRVLGELVAEELRAQGHRVPDPVEVVDTWDAHARLSAGELDLMVEYDGTAASLVGVELSEELEELYAARGFRFGPELGFDNGYRVFVSEERASEELLVGLSDLSGQSLVVASPPEFAQRSADGLGPWSRRYGLQLEGPPLLVSDPAERYELLLAGQADLAVGYATDASLLSRPLRALQDDLGFFPDYRAFVLLGPTAPQGLEGDLVLLEEALDEVEMQALIHKVEVEGYAPRATAMAWRGERGLSPAQPALSPQVRIAVSQDPGLEAAHSRALEAVTRGLPGTSAALLPSEQPLESLRDGSARLAVVGAEDFFEPGRFGPRRVRGVVALAVLGTRVLHVLEKDGHQERVLASAGDARVAALIEQGYRLVDQPADPNEPAARPLRIVPGTYEGQEDVIDTLGLQVVLAGPAPEGVAGLGGGPASGLAAPQSWDSEEIQAMNSAIGTLERPDPSLPSSSHPHVARAPTEPAVRPGEALDTGLDLAALAFLGWIVTLSLKRRPE